MSLLVGMLLGILLIILMTSYFIQGISRNYILIYNIWFVLILIVSFLNLGSFYKISESTYVLIITSIIAFNLSIYFPFRLKSALQIKVSKCKLLFIYEILYFIVNIWYAKKIISIVNIANDYGAVRFVYYGLELDGVTRRLFAGALGAHIYILMYSINTLVFIISLNLFRENNKKLTIISTINMILFCFISGGRDLITFIMIYFIFIFKIKQIRKNLKYLILPIAVILFISATRGSGLDKIKITLISYYTGAIAFLDYWLKHDDGSLFYGKITLSGIIDPFLYILRKIGITSTVSAITEIGTKLMPAIQVSDTNSFYKFYNALATGFYWQYKDFGYFGIIISNFILGIFFNLFYSKRTTDYAIQSYLETMMLLMIFNYKIVSLSTGLILIAYIFITKKGNN